MVHIAAVFIQSLELVSDLTPAFASLAHSFIYVDCHTPSP